jgi:hypothetical protein
MTMGIKVAPSFDAEAVLLFEAPVKVPPPLESLREEPTLGSSLSPLT